MSEVPLWASTSPRTAGFTGMRLIDSCITQLKAQGPARTCNESKEEEEGFAVAEAPDVGQDARRCNPMSLLMVYRRIIGLIHVWIICKIPVNWMAATFFHPRVKRRGVFSPEGSPLMLR